MNNNYSYRGFHQAGLSMSSSQFGQDPPYGRVDSNSQPSYYSAIDKTFPMNSSGTEEPPLFGSDYAADYDGRLQDPSRYDDYAARVNQASFAGNEDFTKSSMEQQFHRRPEEGQPDPVFGVDFPNSQNQRKQWEQFQQHFQQAFEQQLSHQIHLQLQQQQQQQQQQPQGLFGSDSVGRSGNYATAGGADGAAVYFGDDSVGKTKRVGTGEVGDGMTFGETRSNATSRSAAPPRNSKFYCSTCDVSYANSLAFTSHLGSPDHKTQRDKEASRPKGLQPSATSQSPDDSSQSQQAATGSSSDASDATSSKKEYRCHLCNVTCSDAGVYAIHIKSEEHQRILKINNENKRRNSAAAAAAVAISHPQGFGIDLNKAKDSEEDKEAPVGREFLEESENFCNLCSVRVASPAERELHLKSLQHRTLYEERKSRAVPLFGQDIRPTPHPPVFGAGRCGGADEPVFGTDVLHEETGGTSAFQGETEDDRHVRHKHSLIYPTSEDFRAVLKVSGSCIRWLKTVMNNFTDGSKHQKLITGVIKVGQLAKGLLLRYDLSCDVLVMTRDWPTKGVVRSIYRELEVLKEKNTKDDKSPEYVLGISEEEDQITLENVTLPKVKCTVHISSHAIRNANERSDDGEEVDPERLKLENCLKQLEVHDRTMWFQSRGITLPSCVLVVRVFKDIRRDNEGLQSLSDEAIESVVAEAIASLEGMGSKGPGLVLKRTLELLTSTLKTLDCNATTAVEGKDGKEEVESAQSLGEKGDSGKKVDTSCLLSRLTLKQRKDVVKVTTILLEKISLGQMKEVLGLPSGEEKVESATEQETVVDDGGSSEVAKESEDDDNKTPGADDSDIPAKKPRLEE